MTRRTTLSWLLRGICKRTAAPPGKGARSQPGNSASDGTLLTPFEPGTPQPDPNDHPSDEEMAALFEPVHWPEEGASEMDLETRGTIH